MGDYLPQEFSWNEPDFVLTYIVTALVNAMGVQLGVTLMTRGLVVTGTLIREQDYLEMVSQALMAQVDHMSDEVPDEIKTILRSAFDLRELSEFDSEEYEEAYGSLEEMDPDDDDDDPPDVPGPVMHLHLREPTVVAGEMPIGFPEEDRVLRVRLTSVDGWMLGRLTPVPTEFLMDDDDEVRH